MIQYFYKLVCLRLTISLIIYSAFDKNVFGPFSLHLRGTVSAFPLLFSRAPVTVALIVPLDFKTKPNCNNAKFL